MELHTLTLAARFYVLLKMYYSVKIIYTHILRHVYYKFCNSSTVDFNCVQISHVPYGIPQNMQTGLLNISYTALRLDCVFHGILYGTCSTFQWVSAFNHVIHTDLLFHYTN